jgi:acyl CoA:acetate/3-ketoacid CoA transferase alpha subunit
MSLKEKVYSSVDEAVADVADGASIMFGGFGGAGFPDNAKSLRHQQQLRDGRR